jgi:hypothetical protein
MGTHSAQNWCCLLFKSIGFFVHCFGLVFRVNFAFYQKSKLYIVLPNQRLNGQSHHFNLSLNRYDHTSA